jgi:hypothetical protein
MIVSIMVCSTAVSFPFSVSLAEPAYVILPDTSGQTHIIDQSMLVVNVTEGPTTVLRGYNAWIHTELLINGSTLDALVLNVSSPPPVTASWDLEGAVQDLETGIFHGLMHREHGWMRNGTYKYYGEEGTVCCIGSRCVLELSCE